MITVAKFKNDENAKEFVEILNKSNTNSIYYESIQDDEYVMTKFKSTLPSYFFIKDRALCCYVESFEVLVANDSDFQINSPDTIIRYRPYFSVPVEEDYVRLVKSMIIDYCEKDGEIILDEYPDDLYIIVSATYNIRDIFKILVRSDIDINRSLVMV